MVLMLRHQPGVSYCRVQQRASYSRLNWVQYGSGSTQNRHGSNCPPYKVTRLKYVALKRFQTESSVLPTCCSTRRFLSGYQVYSKNECYFLTIRYIEVLGNRRSRHREKGMSRLWRLSCTWHYERTMWLSYIVSMGKTLTSPPKSGCIWAMSACKASFRAEAQHLLKTFHNNLVVVDRCCTWCIMYICLLVEKNYEFDGCP